MPFVTDDRKSVALDFPLWRTIVFPFYTLKSVIFVLLLVGLVTAVVWLAGSPGPLYRYSIAAYVGAALIAYFSSPAHLDAPIADSERVERFLENHGLEYCTSEQSWLPRFPKLLLFSHTRVKLKQEGANIVIEGPYQFLLELRNWLNSSR